MPIFVKPVQFLARQLALIIISTFAICAYGQDLPTKYELSMRGIQLGTLSFEHKLEETQYDLNLHFETTGLAGALFNTTINAKTTGDGIVDGVYEPKFASYEISQDDMDISREMSFEDGVLTNYTSSPRLRSTLDPAKQAGAVDPLTALGYVLRPVALENLCKLNIRIFDGITATRITLSQPSKRPDGRMQCQGGYTREHGFSAEQLEQEGDDFFFTALYRVDRQTDDMIIDRIVGESTYGQFQLLRN